MSRQKIRLCDKRCHQARKPKCNCWCGGAFHGAAGAANRQALQQGSTKLLKKYGFKKGKTAYIAQTTLPFEMGKPVL
ncbi:MAG: hypothetical protein PHU23_00020 [Dehalococcoidales bacterium]|nr:hypothetical protein [Dehalococcoidales bacterium]